MYFVENDVNDESDRSMNIEIDKGKKKRDGKQVFSVDVYHNDLAI